MPNAAVIPFAADPAALVDRAAMLKESIAEMSEELRGINFQLAGQADYKEGSKTGHLIGRHYSAKVQLKENVKWDQAALNALRQTMGDEEFFKVFKWIFEPASAKTLAGALQFGQHGPLIEAARTVTPGTPYVTFEHLERC